MFITQILVFILGWGVLHIHQLLVLAFPVVFSSCTMPKQICFFYFYFLYKLGDLVTFCCFSTLVKILLKILFSLLPTKICSSLGASSVSGFFAAACSLPFDYVKTQIQKMQPDADGKYPYTGSVDCAVKTFKAGGPFKFYTGFPVYCVRIAPHVMVLFYNDSFAFVYYFDILMSNCINFLCR